MIRILQIFFYLSSVFLWFKDNFPPLRKIALSPVFPLIGLAVVLGVRGMIKFQAGHARFRIRISKEWVALLIFILLATIVRTPCFLHDYGLVDSDEAISLLQGKHIAEGKIPPIYYYGALYQGTLSQHFYALLFLIFGYSPFIAKLASHLIFLAFLVVYYLFLKDVFSRGFALIAGLFYALPLVYLLQASLEIASGYSLVFLLTSVIFYLTFLIYERRQDRLLAPLGFIMGLAFWTHPVSIIAILSAWVFLILRFRVRPRPYAVLGLNFLLGTFPVLLGEFFEKFPLLPILASGEDTWSISGDKIDRFWRLLQSLISSEPSPMGIIGLAFLGFGIVALIGHSLKKKKLLFSSLFAIYFFVFAFAFLLSSWSITDVIRYLYILYLALPVLLFSPLWRIRSKLKYGLCLLLLTGFLAANNARAVLSYYESVRRADRIYHDTIDAMEETGVRYWMGDYWRAYVLTALSGEKLIVDSLTMNRYLPYRLAYYNEGQGDSYVFMGEKDSTDDLCARNLDTLLTRLDIPFQKKSFGWVSLFYHIDSPVFPAVLKEEAPAIFPRLEIDAHRFHQAYLHLTFRSVEPADSDKFSLNVEVPGFSAIRTPLAPGNDRVSVVLPYPPGGPFTLRYFLDYKALRIPSSVREIVLESAPEEPSLRAGEIVFLRGISSPLLRDGRDVRFCEREAVLQVIPPESGRARLRLSLDSPFHFSYFLWYGRYSQKVFFRLNEETVLEKELQDGMNVIDVDLTPYAGHGTLEITLTFSWHLWFKFADFHRLAAILYGVEFVDETRADPIEGASREL